MVSRLRAEIQAIMAEPVKFASLTGNITALHHPRNKPFYGFIAGNDGETYWFLDRRRHDNLKVDDQVVFTLERKARDGKYPVAGGVQRLANAEAYDLEQRIMAHIRKVYRDYPPVADPRSGALAAVFIVVARDSMYYLGSEGPRYLTLVPTAYKVGDVGYAVIDAIGRFHKEIGGFDDLAGIFAALPDKLPPDPELGDIVARDLFAGPHDKD